MIRVVTCHLGALVTGGNSVARRLRHTMPARLTIPSPRVERDDDIVMLQGREAPIVKRISAAVALATLAAIGGCGLGNGPV